ncbi:hypothetical protein YTPLAS18_27870 [Nitrospira sp.]|nr:hypothetical protein YTPLAS18_27870 [Nitrospira sp.]
MPRQPGQSSYPGSRSFDLTDFSLRDMTECGAVLRTLGTGAADLPDAMQRVAQYLFTHLRGRVTSSEQCVLVRGFATRPFGELPATDRALAQSALGRPPRSPAMKCLMLMGTAGARPEWNDRTQSRRYRAIPLISQQFVARFPMFAQLLKQLGVELKPTLQPDSDLLLDWEEEGHNVFYVPDAVGSPYVPVQEEFVCPHGVRSVLGFGGALSSGHLFVVILFATVRIPPETADHFRTLAMAVKLALLSHDPKLDEAAAKTGPKRAGRSLKRPSPVAEGSMRTEAKVLHQLLSMHERTVIAHVIQRDVAEARLERLRRDYELLLTSVRDGLYGVDLEGNVTFLNPSASTMLGWPVVELIGRPMHALIHYCRADRTAYPSDECPVYRTLREGVAHSSAEEVYWRRDGTCFPVEYASTPILDRGDIVGAVVTFRDITERRRAEEVLRKTEQRFAAFMDHLPGFAWIKDAQGRHLYANRMFRQTLVRGMDWQGKTAHELWPREIADQYQAHDQEVVAAAAPWQRVESYLQDGRVRHALVSKFQIGGGEGVPLLIGGIAIDVTEKARTEQALRESEERYRRLVHVSPDCIFVIRGGRVVFINEQGVNLFGASHPDQILGKFPLDLVHPDCRAKTDARMRSLDGEVRTVPLEQERYVRLDGAIVDVEVTATQVMDHAQRSIQVVARDITERKRAEAELARAQARYRSIFEHAVEGIYQTTAEGRFLDANPALASMCGYDSSQDLMESVNDIAAQLYVEPGDRETFRRRIEEDGVVRGFEYQLYRKDRSRFWVSEHARAVRDGRGGMVCYEGMVEDITERREAQSRLQETLERLRMLSVRLEHVREEERTRIARELHDELGVGLTCLKMDLARVHGLVESATAGDGQHAVLERLQGMTSQIDGTILAVQRIVAELRPGVLDDLGLVASIEWQCRDFERRSGLACRFTTNTEDMTVDPDRATAVFRICQEALTNVARHAGATAVSVGLRQDGEHVRLEVRDNGAGIPQNKLSDSKAFGLIGMQERAQAFQGTLRVTGEAGVGTTVTMDMRTRA